MQRRLQEALETNVLLRHLREVCGTKCLGFASELAKYMKYSIQSAQISFFSPIGPSTNPNKWELNFRSYGTPLSI